MVHGAPRTPEALPYPELEISFSASRDGPIFSSPPPSWWTFFPFQFFHLAPNPRLNPWICIVETRPVGRPLFGILFPGSSNALTGHRFCASHPSLTDIYGSRLTLVDTAKNCLSCGQGGDLSIWIFWAGLGRLKVEGSFLFLDVRTAQGMVKFLEYRLFASCFIWGMSI